MMTILSNDLPAVIASLEGWVLIYFALVNGCYAILLVLSARELATTLHRGWNDSRWRLLSSHFAPTVSVIAPAHNEAYTVEQSVRALLALHYANLEVVVVNDGSSDDTLAILQRCFDLVPIHTIVWRRVDSTPVRGLYRSRTHPNLLVADKENGGKADALNAGLNLATGELACAIDADTLIEPDALQRMVPSFAHDDRVVAAGGAIRVVNGVPVRAGHVREVRAPRRWLAGIQSVEYLRAYYAGRLGWNLLGGNLVISGAFGLFRRESVIEVGGYTREAIGEDMDLIVKLRRRGYERGAPVRVEFLADSVAWTEVPESLRILGGQRDRWHRGLADVLLRHRDMLCNPRYGTLGLVALPYFLLVELLAPVAELLGLLMLGLSLALGTFDRSFALLFFVVAYGTGVLLSAASVLLEEVGFHRHRRVRDRLLLILWILVENLGYRQLTVWWRLRGLWRMSQGSASWGPMTRTGFRAPTPVSTARVA